MNGITMSSESVDPVPVVPIKISQPRHPIDGEHYIAALDLGTNNCRLLIARKIGDGFEVVDSFSRIIRLGVGLSQSGELSQTAMQRTIAALRICAHKIQHWHVEEMRCIATQACRQANNGKNFIDRIRNLLSLPIEIISAHEEVNLALIGCAPLFDKSISHAIMFDVGGGSTEIGWSSITSDPFPQLLNWLSIPQGVITLSEKYPQDPTGASIYEVMIAEIQKYLLEFDRKHHLGPALMAGNVQIIGASGTITTLAAILLGLPYYQRNVVDGSKISFIELAVLGQELALADFDKRAIYKCIGRQRADFVVSGCAIIEAIRRTWPVEKLCVADRGLREGILWQLSIGKTNTNN